RLRGPPRLVAAPRAWREPLLPRDRRTAGRPRRTPRLHARRTPAHHRAPVLRLLGVPDPRLLRPDVPLRGPAGLHVPRGHAPPTRPRRHPRLGPRPLRHRPTGPHALRRHAALRGGRRADAPPPRLGHLRLRLRQAGRPELPALLRPLLARPLPRGRPPRGRRGEHALPRLQPGRVDAERPRRTRKPGGDPL